MHTKALETLIFMSLFFCHTALQASDSPSPSMPETARKAEVRAALQTLVPELKPAAHSAPSPKPAPAAPPAPGFPKAKVLAPTAHEVAPAASPSPTDANHTPAREDQLQHVVMRGDTLDRLINRVMPSTPFNPVLVRRAFAQANPERITGNPKQRLTVGTIVIQPTTADIMAVFEGQSIAENPMTPTGTIPRATTAPATAPAPNPGPSAAELERKSWVRFP